MARRQGPKRTLLVLGGVTVLGIGAILAVTQMRSPVNPDASPTTSSTPTSSTTSVPPTTVPTTTTTTEFVLQGEMGVPFEWTRSTEFTGKPISLVEHDGEFFLFGTLDTDGLRTMSSPDGTEWSVLSEVRDVSIASVTSTRFGLIAVGEDATTGEGVVLRSSDGADWDRTVVADGLPNHIQRSFQRVVSTDDLIYIPLQASGSDYAILQLQVGEAMEAHFGEDTRWTISEIDDAWFVDIFGPLGVMVGSVTPEEIGLTDAHFEQTEWVFLAPEWVSTDGINWVEREFSWTSSNAFVGPDGRIWALQSRTEGQTFGSSAWALQPSDLRWVEVGPPFSGIPVHQWSGGLVGHRNGTAYSADGTFWRSIEPEAQLNEGTSWSVSPMSGGEAGMAFVAATTLSGFTEPEPVEWTQGDHTIRATWHDLEILHEGRSVFRISRFSRGQSGSRDPVWDEAANTLTFFDTSGNELIVLDLDLVPDHLPGDRRSRASEYDPYRPTGQAFIFSDAATWPTPGVLEVERAPMMTTIQDLSPVTEFQVRLLLLASDRVILVTEGPDESEVFVGLIPGAP